MRVSRGLHAATALLLLAAAMACVEIFSDSAPMSAGRLTMAVLSVAAGAAFGLLLIRYKRPS